MKNTLIVLIVLLILIVICLVGLSICLLKIKSREKKERYSRVSVDGGNAGDSGEARSANLLNLESNVDSTRVISQEDLAAAYAQMNMAEQMPPITVMFKNAGNGKEFTGNLVDELEIGRGVSGPKAIKIPEKQISKLHCKLIRRGNMICIVDCRSSYNTFVNGQMVMAETALQSGDSVGIGPFTYRFTILNG